MDQLEKRRRRPLIVLPCLAVVCTAVALLCMRYINVLDRTMQAETERYLTEISRHIQSRLEYQIDAGFKGLESTAQSYPLFESRAQSDAYLESVAERFHYECAGTVTPDGVFHNVDGSTQALPDSAALEAVLAGERQVVTVRSPQGGTSFLLYMVPLYRDGAIVGALAAGGSEAVLQAFFRVESFGGEGFSAIIDQSGGFIVTSENKNARHGAKNFFRLLEEEGTPLGGSSLERLEEDIAAGRSGTLRYALGDGMEKVLNYQPLWAEDWYLLSVVPSSVSLERSQPLVRAAVRLAAVIVALFVLLMLLFGVLSRVSWKGLERVAYVDEVTGGCSRAKFELNAERAIRSAPAGTYAIVCLDIQQFKIINDAFTSREGDSTLRYVYQTLQSGLRRGEMAARFSADTFYLLLFNASREELTGRLSRMAEQVNFFNERLEKKYYLPFSMGVYIVDDPSLDLIIIQDRANAARKHNRRLGREHLSACAFYTEKELGQLLWEKEIDNRLDTALAEGEFVLRLQPKVSLGDSRVAGAEALVRWQVPGRGLVAPDEFIPAMERSGAITRLDLHMFERVCRLLRRWLDEGRAPVPVAVNLSRVQLEDWGFLEAYRRLLEQYRVPPSLIELELTESMVLEDPRRVADAVARIHALGLRCALDDFGSGYSSLNALKEIPADVLKLDRAFFTGPADDTRGQRVVEAALGLAQRLEMQSVAEGVERMEQVDFLCRAGCDMVQGFAFYRPMPVEQFEALAFGAQEREAGRT